MVEITAALLCLWGWYAGCSQMKDSITTHRRLRWNVKFQESKSCILGVCSDLSSTKLSLLLQIPEEQLVSWLRGSLCEHHLIPAPEPICLSIWCLIFWENISIETLTQFQKTELKLLNHIHNPENLFQNQHYLSCLYIAILSPPLTSTFPITLSKYQFGCYTPVYSEQGTLWRLNLIFFLWDTLKGFMTRPTMSIFKTGRIHSEAVRNSTTYGSAGYTSAFSSSSEANTILGDLKL